MKNESTKVLIHRNDGGVSVMNFMTKCRLDAANAVLQHWTEHETDEGWYVREASEKNVAEEIARAGLDCVSFELVADDVVPTERAFRDAWTKCPVNKIKVDMDKARGIHMDRLRGLRNARLEKLDQRKYGPEFDAERQALRDLPQNFDLSKAKTPEELKNLIPEELA